MTWNDFARRYCECGHRDVEHSKKIGRCTQPDSYGFRCTCSSFVMDVNGLEDG